MGVLFVLWYITRPLRALAAALLLMPWPVSPNHQEWGPAWVVSLFDGLAREDVSLWRAGGPLLAVLLLALLLAGAEIWRQRRKQDYLQSEN